MMTVILPRGQATLLRFADIRESGYYEPCELVIGYDVEPATGSIVIHRRDVEEGKTVKKYRPLVIPMKQTQEDLGSEARF